jgi:hypothetical protein
MLKPYIALWKTRLKQKSTLAQVRPKMPTEFLIWSLTWMLWRITICKETLMLLQHYQGELQELLLEVLLEEEECMLLLQCHKTLWSTVSENRIWNWKGSNSSMRHLSTVRLTTSNPPMETLRSMITNSGETTQSTKSRRLQVKLTRSSSLLTLLSVWTAKKVS